MCFLSTHTGQAAEQRRQDNLWCGNNDSGVDSPVPSAQGDVASAGNATDTRNGAQGTAAADNFQAKQQQRGSTVATTTGTRPAGRAASVPSSTVTTSTGQNNPGSGQPSSASGARTERPSLRRGLEDRAVIVLDDDDVDGTRPGVGAGVEPGPWACRHCTYINEGPKRAVSVCALCSRTQH